ncbi:hypothetical protein [Oerskovia jenensis]|uniref:hypothetical protein n=1 Tax=Oerskovia jenensis TaxID=162169 RepID=UPI0031D346AF
MKVLRTVTTTAVSAALVLGGGAAAFAAEGADAPEAGAPAAPDAGTSSVGGEQAAPAAEAPTPEAPAAPAPVVPAATTHAAPVNPVVAPAPEVPVVAPAVEAADTPAPEGTAPEADPAEAPAGDPAETPAADPAGETAPEADAVTAETAETPPEALTDAPAGASAFGALQATPVYPDADYHPHWEDGGEDGFGCDYWYFMELGDVTSGRDWQGWYGSPQLHILHHTLKDADGTVHMVYDRDIANYWYHVWSGDETVTPDAEGIHWENTSAQQTVLVNGYKGGADEAARGIDAQALFARAGVVQNSVTIEQYQSYIDNGWWTQAQAEEYVASENARRADYTAYEATQFAVWYFSTGHDVMGLFFDVDDAGHVTLSQKALDQFTAQVVPENPDETFQYDGTRNWDDAYNQSDRMATMQTAAWLIEQALTTNVVMPQPGFVSHGYLKNSDGSTDYGFTASLVGGTGDIHVELRTADGQAVPAGVTLVDANGATVTSVTPGQQVFVRVPAGLDVASLPQFQLWGSAQGTEQGSPHFYTGNDHNNHGAGTYDEDGQWSPTFPHWLIGLGELDQPSTAWDWVGISLADEPEAPVVPEDPTEPENPVVPEDPEAPVVETAAVDPIFLDTGVTATTVAPVTSSDPTNLGLTRTVPVAGVAQAAPAVNLASTGADAGALALAGAFIVLTGTGLVLAGRRRTRTTER